MIRYNPNGRYPNGRYGKLERFILAHANTHPDTDDLAELWAVKSGKSAARSHQMETRRAVRNLERKGRVATSWTIEDCGPFHRPKQHLLVHRLD